MSFVELSGNKGWIVESAKERAVLEKSLDGQFIVENITGRYYFVEAVVVSCCCCSVSCCILGSFASLVY